MPYETLANTRSKTVRRPRRPNPGFQQFHQRGGWGGTEGSTPAPQTGSDVRLRWTCMLLVDGTSEGEAHRPRYPAARSAVSAVPVSMTPGNHFGSSGKPGVVNGPR